MKASINKHGVITLSAESEIEAYALNHWVKEAMFMQEDLARTEQCYVRGSRLIVSVDVEAPDEPR